jgi:integrase
MEPYRTMVVVAQCLGLRVSEILALQWPDINFAELTMRVSRAVVDGIVDEVKTEYSEDDLPLDPDVATVLFNWKNQCPESDEHWVFPSPITGRCYHASPIQQDHIRPAGRHAALHAAATKPDLHRDHAGKAAARADRAEEGTGHRGP